MCTGYIFYTFQNIDFRRGGMVSDFVKCHVPSLSYINRSKYNIPACIHVCVHNVNSIKCCEGQISFYSAVKGFWQFDIMIVFPIWNNYFTVELYKKKPQIHNAPFTLEKWPACMLAMPFSTSPGEYLKTRPSSILVQIVNCVQMTILICFRT